MKITTICATVMSATVCALTSSALATNGVVLIWGTNNYGQVAVPSSLGPCSQIAAGSTFTLAVDASGVIKAWGSNSYGQLSVPSFQYPIVQIAAGAFHSMALQSTVPTSSTTNVSCWGAGRDNTGSIPNLGQSKVPSNLGSCDKIAAGYYHSLAIQKGGYVAAWGDNRWNQSTVPTTLGPCIQIACGYAHSLAIRSTGQVIGWGAGTTNTGITPNLGQSIVPSNLGTCTQVAAGEYFSVALQTSGKVVSWGLKLWEDPSNLGSCTAIAAGNRHCVAIQSSGNIVAVGDNNYGQTNVQNYGSTLSISASTYDTVAIQTDPCDVDADGTPNYLEAGEKISSWLFPTATSTFEKPANWSAGVPGYDTDAKITGNPQIKFDCDNSVKTLELSTGSSNWSPGVSLNLSSHELNVRGGKIAFAPSAGQYMPYSVNINDGFIYTSPTGGVPLRFESDHATWNINGTQLYSPSTELATIASSQIDVKLNDSILYTAAIAKGDATAGSRHIELLNSSIQDFQGGLTFGDGISLSLGSIMVGGNDNAQNSIVSYGVSGAVFQPGSFLDAWGNLSFVGSASFSGQLDLHAFPSTSHGQSKITVQGSSFNYGAGSSASPFAVMNVYGSNFNQPTCSPPQCADEGLITLQGSLASIGGPLFIQNTDSSIPAEGNLYTLISLDPTYQGGAFDPNNNKFSTVRWVGQPLQNGLTFEQILSSDKLQLQCVRAPIVEPAPTNTTNLASVPFASANADFTNDGRDDVVNLIVGSSNSVQIMRDVGDGTFKLLRTFALPSGVTLNAIAAGNVVGDSTPEIAVTLIQSGVGYLRLYKATGEMIWTRTLDSGELPTCVCMLTPTVTGGAVGKVAVGTQEIVQANLNVALVNSRGAVKTVAGDNSTSQSTPVNSVPRTVHSSDIDDDDLTDVTAAGSTSAASFDLAPLGFIQVVKVTKLYPQALTPQFLDYVPVSITTGDIDGDGVKDIFAACNAIPSSIPASTRPVACFLRGSVSAASGIYTMSSPTGISVGRPVQGKAIALVQRNGGFSLAVASTDGVNDSVDVIELNAFTNGSLSIGNQTPISTSGTVIGLRTLKDQGTQKFATVRNVTRLIAGAVIESTGYVELLFGDFDGSGTIDTGDLSFMLLSFGDPGITDLDGSGVTDSGDASLLLLLFS
jgi:hypothetical protein